MTENLMVATAGVSVLEGRRYEGWPYTEAI
jgi:hypothetical protein